jgi:hypothetical protein
MRASTSKSQLIHDIGILRGLCCGRCVYNLSNCICFTDRDPTLHTDSDTDPSDTDSDIENGLPNLEDEPDIVDLTDELVKKEIKSER